MQMIPVVASNRVGTEVLLDDNGQERQRITFYGRSFITNETGEIVKEAGKGGSPNGRDILVSDIITGENRANRAAWGLFRDRRPELYGILQTKDGSTHMK
jgi:N-carbamoylputrescine amidase